VIQGKMQEPAGIVALLSNLCDRVAMCSVVVMLGVVVCDVVGAKVFNRPLHGAVELAAFLGALLAAFGAVRTYIQRRHVTVGFVLFIMPPKMRNVARTIALSASALVIGLLCYRMLVYAYEIFVAGEQSLELEIPYAPIVFAVAFAFFVLFLVVLLDFKEFKERVLKDIEEGEG